MSQSAAPLPLPSFQSRPSRIPRCTCGRIRKRKRGVSGSRQTTPRGPFPPPPDQGSWGEEVSVHVRNESDEIQQQRAAFSDSKGEGKPGEGGKHSPSLPLFSHRDSPPPLLLLCQQYRKSKESGRKRGGLVDPAEPRSQSGKQGSDHSWSEDQKHGVRGRVVFLAGPCSATSAYPQSTVPSPAPATELKKKSAAHLPPPSPAKAKEKGDAALPAREYTNTHSHGKQGCVGETLVGDNNKNRVAQ